MFTKSLQTVGAHAQGQSPWCRGQRDYPVRACLIGFGVKFGITGHCLEQATGMKADLALLIHWKEMLL